MKNWEVWAGLDRTATLGEMVEQVAKKILKASQCVENGNFKGEEILSTEADTICELISNLFNIEPDRLDDIVSYKINDLCEEARK